MSNIHLQGLWSKLKHLGAHRDFRTISDKAHHDWKYMVVGSAVAAGVIVTTSFLLFARVSSGEIFINQPSSTQTEVSLDSDLLGKVLSEYRGKAIREATSTSLNIFDPSL